MNTEKTRRYYAQLTEEDICGCAYCRHYVKEIRAAYPELAGFLNASGIDIEKPFETIPICPANGMMFYSGVQYVVMGSADDFEEASVGNVRVLIAGSHPMTYITEDHFVIEVSPIYLKWTGEP